MKKKFKRSVEKTTAKIRQRRIMSALLAFSVFVSNGVFSKFSQVGFTAVAEGEDVLEPVDSELIDNEEQTEENDIVTPDDSEQTDGDGESAIEDEEINNAEDDSGQPDSENIPIGEDESDNNAEENEQTDEESNNDDDGAATLAEESDDGDGDNNSDGEEEEPTPAPVVFDIRVKPEKYPDIVVDSWENNTVDIYNPDLNNSKDNPYIIRGTQQITVCGETTNFEFVECDDSECNHKKATKRFLSKADDDNKSYTDEKVDVCFELKDSQEKPLTFMLSDDSKSDGISGYTEYKNEKLSISDDFTYEIVPKQDGTYVLLVSATISSKAIGENESIVTRKLVFNDGTQGMAEENYKDWQDMYISVRPETSYIKVYSEVMNRDMNHVNEYVNDANLSNESKVHVRGTTIENSRQTPYLLLQGDSVFIKGTGTMLDDSHNRGANGSVLTTRRWVDNSYVYENSVTVGSDSVIKNDEDGFIKLTVPDNGSVNNLYYVNYDTGKIDADNNKVYERFYFKIYNNQSTNWPPNYWDHSDIEIADGGTYKIETEKLDAEGKKYIEVVEYSVEVSDVNKCEIYGGKTTEQDNKPSEIANAQPLMIHNQFWEKLTTDEEKNYYKGIISKIGKGEALSEEEQTKYNELMSKYQFPREMTYIPASDYWKDPSIQPGDDQFELTSKYIRDDGGIDESGKYKQGSVNIPSIGDNLRYEMKDVGGAKFYLQLLLKPEKVTYYNEDKTTIKQENVPLDGYTELTISNAEFPMSYQSVLDAFNKCPDHSGLDFTIKSDINEIIQINPIQEQIKAKKILENKELEENQFSFELYYIPDGANPDLIETVTNDGNGLINFAKLPFVEAGTYKYQIKELSGNDDTITYDTGIIDVTIEVTKNDDNNTLTATTTYKKNGKELEDPTFTNIYNAQKFYKLPLAGGTGVYIYIISGVGLMLSAAVMYRRKRKEE